MPALRKVSLGFIALCMALIPKEGHVSRVYYNDIGLEALKGDVWHAVEAKDLGESEVFLRIVLSKATSYNGEEETIYTETVKLYRVERVLESPSLKPGDIIRVWQQPLHGIDVVTHHHRTGGFRSFASDRYVPMLAPETTHSNEVLLLGFTLRYRSVIAYELLGTENPANAEAVRTTLEQREHSENAPPVRDVD